MTSQLFNTIALTLQVLSALAVILLVLLQHGKGADMGAAFGSGASGSLFGATGSANFLSRLTAAMAAVFFVSTLALAWALLTEAGLSFLGLGTQPPTPSLGLMLAEIRNLARSHAGLRAGQWLRDFPNSAEIPELCGKTVGLVGYGAVGQLVAHYLEAFGSQIVACDPYFQGDPAPAQLVTLDELLCRADVVSLHARLTPESEHLIGARELALMKRSAVLVNTARSGLVDEAALIDALQSRTIMGAAIDVFDHEPLAADHPLLKLDNVTVTPHLAGSTIDAFRNSPRLTADHLIRLLDGQERVPIVNGIRPVW